MKKLLAFLAGLLCTMLVLLCGCSSNEIPERPADTNLEFWIAEDVTGHKWDKNCVLAGCGFVNYYDRVVTIGEHGEMIPEHYVEYSLGVLSQCSRDVVYITRIKVTDPAIVMYGLTINSSYEEFDNVFQKMGYEITERKEDGNHIAKKGNYSFRFVWKAAIFIEEEANN